MKRIVLIVLLFNCLFSFGQNELNLVPMPAEIKMGKGMFALNKNTDIVLEGSGLEKTADLLNNYMYESFGYRLNITSRYAGANSISLNYERLDNQLPGAYNMTINSKGIYFAGDNAEGVFYGIQTLIHPTSQHEPAPAFRRAAVGYPGDRSLRSSAYSECYTYIVPGTDTRNNSCG